jgi:hypothetical protein
MHIPVGETWPLEDINDLRDKIAAVGLERSEIERGPETARCAMSVVCALMLHRYKSGGAPIALVSKEVCSRIAVGDDRIDPCQSSNPGGETSGVSFEEADRGHGFGGSKN